MGGHPRYVSYLHDEAGNRARLTHPDGAAFGFGHDALGRVTSVLDNPAFASTDDLVIRYWYKPEGPRHAAVRGTGSAGFTTVFYYDALQRPEAIHNDLPADGADVSFTFGYNRAGQIVSRTISHDSYAAPAAVNVSRPYQVNGLNQYTQVSHLAYSYDPNGNLASDGESSFVYDVENRLVSASGLVNASLVYDPLGRLFQTSGGPAGTTRFLYDGDRMIAEYDGAGALLRRYVHGPGADEPVAVYEGAALGTAGRRYTLPDERGSIAALVNADGSPSAVNGYDSWGLSKLGSQGGRFQYTGQAWLPELGMYYYKARIYSPRLGRFLQTDPIGYEDQINLYAYVHNDPINFSDSTGECSSIANEKIRTDCLDKRSEQVESAKAYLDPQSIRSGKTEAAYIATYNENTGDVTVRMGDDAAVRTNTDVIFTNKKGGEQLVAQRDGRIVQKVDGDKRTTHEIVLVTGHAHPKENVGGGALSRSLDQANDNIRTNQIDRTLSRVAPAVIKGTTGTIRVYVNGKEVK